MMSHVLVFLCENITIIHGLGKKILGLGLRFKVVGFVLFFTTQKKIVVSEILES
jgi:hypothetical protein